MDRETLRKHCEKMCKMYESAPSSNAYMEHKLVLDLLDQTEWIPVSERLPEKEGKYLVTTFSGGIYDVDISYFFIWEDGETEWGEYGVESWMPLPQSLKGEQENG